MSRRSAVVPMARARRDSQGQQQIHLFENHDEALFVWRRAGVSSRILVHVDPHHDMWWNRPGTGITFANYVCAALQEDLVRQVYWVIPDPSWATVRNRQQILDELRGILRAYPGAWRNLRFERRRAHMDILGKSVEVCSPLSLPELEEPALLDLDTDFRMLPRVADNPSADHPELPCCWPEDLVAQMAARSLRWDLATIAYSVEGGYTPLRWKYLGQELALRLGASPSDDVRLSAMAHLRGGAEADSRGDLEAAAVAYHAAAAQWPDSAAPLLHMALLRQRLGDLDQAQSLYRRALECDPSYRTAYSSEGLWHYWKENWQAAALEFRRTLELNPDDATSLVGLAWLAMRRKRWADAEALLRKALAADPAHLDAWRAIGEVMERQGRHGEACPAFERSLQLALAGGKSRLRPPPIYTGAPRLLDLDHWRVFVDIGRLYRKQGNRLAAGQRFGMALAGGYESLDVHWQMLLLGTAGGYGRAKQAWQCAIQALRAGANLIRPLWDFGQRLYELYRSW
jgi:tetratricopeptide (TPR) repeat protein